MESTKLLKLSITTENGGGLAITKRGDELFEQRQQPRWKQGP